LVETVLSSGKYRASVELARQRGFHFNLIYITLFPAELSPARVGERVKKGGHAVAWDKAIERYHRSHTELIWFARQADLLMIFDNSSDNGEPRLIFGNDRLQSKSAGEVIYPIVHERGVNPVIDGAVVEAFPCLRGS
jgi:predicted ABC-type ATPase